MLYLPRFFKLLIVLSLLALPLQSYANSPMTEFEQAMKLHHGKVVYLDFWASWCVPCRKSFPWMNKMQSTYGEQGFVVLSVNLDKQIALAKKFLEETPANFAIIYDSEGVLAQKFQLKGMPSSYLFNRQGELISGHHGFNGKKKQLYELEITTAITQKP